MEENVGDRTQIPVQQIVTFGKDVLIISDSVDPSNRGPLGGRPMEGIVSRSAPVGAYPPAETAPATASYSPVPPVDEAAQRLNVSRNTARCQIRAIFAKTGVTRQTELLRVLLSGVAPLV